MAVTLPTLIGPAAAEPYFLDSGGVQRSMAAGEDMRIDRLGDRFGMSVTLPPLRWHSTFAGLSGRVWVRRLIEGKSAGAIVPFPQPNFTPPGGVLAVGIAAGSGASQVSVFNNFAQVTVLEGQFVTHIRAATGRRYLYQVRADTVLGANTVMPLWPRVRGPMAVGDVLNFAAPTIEGFIGGDQQAWSLEGNRLASIVFRVEERA